MDTSLHFAFIFMTKFILCSLFEIEIKQCRVRGKVPGLCREASECVNHMPDPVDSCQCDSGQICCPAGFISERRCFEYSKYVYSENSGAMTFSAFVEAADELEDDCGSLDSIPLIIGGVKAEKKEFPHMAALGYETENGKENWACGGTLISETYILTAAHCVITNHGEPKFVKLGVTNIERDEGGKVQLLGVKKTIHHPQYDAMNQTHDVALIETDRPASFSPYVRPACLDFAGVLTEEHFVATGWGVVDTNTGASSPDLMKVQMGVIDWEVCQNSVDFHTDHQQKLLHSQLCAGDLRGGKDACQGDSGGPLQVLMTSPYCMFSIVGVTSYGAFCGYKDTPGVYARVFSFVPWIESIVWPND